MDTIENYFNALKTIANGNIFQCKSKSSDDDETNTNKLHDKIISTNNTLVGTNYPAMVSSGICGLKLTDE